MKFGVADYGMSVWDGGLYDLEMRIDELKSIGYDGIERLDAIDSSDAMNKAVCFHRMGMDFSTCRGPSISSGIEWTCGFGKKYVWLTPGPAGRDVDFATYCRRSNKFIKAVKRHGIKAVLHNHLGARIERQNELDDFMKACPDAYLLLDIGHLHGAGGDVVGTIEKYHDRIEAVHFKDIEIKDKSIGIERWGERLRFCELGAGNAGVDYAGAAKALLKHGYDGWVFIEHDTHTDEPVKQLKTSLELVRKAFSK